MSQLNDLLGQSRKYHKQDGQTIELPYRTNFSFVDSYPYAMKKVGVNQLRIDHLAQKITGTPSGWRMLCIFNDIISPLELSTKEYLYLPEDYNQAISWLRQKNARI